MVEVSSRELLSMLGTFTKKTFAPSLRGAAVEPCFQPSLGENSFIFGTKSDITSMRKY